jgi:hypothetical protein
MLGGSITITAENAEVDGLIDNRLYEVTPGQYVVPSAADSGVGMSADMSRASPSRSSPPSRWTKARRLASRWSMVLGNDPKAISGF